MSVRLTQAAGTKPAGVSADVKGWLAKRMSEVVERASRSGWSFASEDILPGVFASLDATRSSKTVRLGFIDKLFYKAYDRLVEEVVAEVMVAAERTGYKAWLLTKDDLPPSWWPPQHLSLLPAAFNAALSVLGVDRRLSRGLGLRLEARGVQYRRMYTAWSLERVPVVIVDLNVNGKPFTLKSFRVEHRPRRREVHLDFDVLFRHGDRKLARRLYVLAWLRRELGDALRRLSEEKGYSYEADRSYGSYPGEWMRRVYRVRLGDKEVEITRPEVSVGIRYFDEEYIVTGFVDNYEYSRGEKINLAEMLAKIRETVLEEVELESSRLVAALIQDARRLLSSEDPREKDLGHLLAVLIKRAYEEAEMAIPG